MWLPHLKFNEFHKTFHKLIQIFHKLCSNINRSFFGVEYWNISENMQMCVVIALLPTHIGLIILILHNTFLKIFGERNFRMAKLDSFSFYISRRTKRQFVLHCILANTLLLFDLFDFSDSIIYNATWKLSCEAKVYCSFIIRLKYSIWCIKLWQEILWEVLY